MVFKWSGILYSMDKKGWESIKEKFLANSKRNKKAEKKKARQNKAMKDTNKAS